MRLVDWAKLQGVHYLTAYRWWRNGTLPVPAHQTPGRILCGRRGWVPERPHAFGPRDYREMGGGRSLLASAGGDRAAQ